MMGYIDLSDDSDDDLPLIPPKVYKQPTKRVSQPKRPIMKDDTIVLVSSDDDVPILKRPKEIQKSSSHLPARTDINTDSDNTIKYSSDEDSLPDLSVDIGLGVCKSFRPPNQGWNSDTTEKYSDSSDFSSSLGLPDLECDLPLESTTSSTDYQTNIEKSENPINSDKNLPTKSAQSKVNLNQVNDLIDSTNRFTNIKSKVAKSTIEAASKKAERERVKAEKELERQRKREEKEKNALNKRRDLAMRDAEREARRAAQPGECHRHMLLEVDKKLESTTLGVCVEAMCVANNVPMKYVQPPLSNTIIFKRRLISPDSSSASYVQEDNMAVVMQMADMVDMCLSMLDLNSTHLSLSGYLEKVRRHYQSKVSLIVLGCDKYFRTIKTQNNRVYRDNVCGTNHNSKKNKDMSVITRLQYEEAITSLQMTTDTVVIQHELEEDVAKTILRLNKAIAEAPVKRDKYETEAMTVRTVGLKIAKDNTGCRQVWQRMLQESRNISADVAAAIVSQWPSPYMLYKEYEQLRGCEAEVLLQDIQIRRGGGVVQTTRRVGKETSRRVYELFTKHPEFIIK